MRFFIWLFFVFCATSCWSTTIFRSGTTSSETSGPIWASPVEAAAAHATVVTADAQADLIRAQARTVENHPELVFGWRYGWGSYGQINPSYYFPAIASASVTVANPSVSSTLPERRVEGGGR